LGAPQKPMHTLSELSRRLSRPSIELRDLLTRYEVPLQVGAGYSEACLAWLRVIVHLRTLGVPEKLLRELWTVEKKLLTLLHLDAGGSPTWFLDACRTGQPARGRLLLSQREIGSAIELDVLQPGLDLAPSEPELFAGEVMGEDAMRLLGDYRQLLEKVRRRVRDSLPAVRASLNWGARRFP